MILEKLKLTVVALPVPLAPFPDFYVALEIINAIIILIPHFGFLFMNINSNTKFTFKAEQKFQEYHLAI